MSDTKPLDHWRLFGFHGGVQPPEHKWTANQASYRMAIASELLFPLQRRQVSLTPVVQPGDHVLAGDLLAIDPDNRQAPIVASTSGTIGAMTTVIPPLPNPEPWPAVRLHPDGQDRFRSGDVRTMPSILQTDRNALIERIHRAGIIGLGGAGFPTAAKLRASGNVPTVLLNGAECEPFITSDDRLMQENATDILCGGWIIAHITQAERIVVAIEDNKPDAITAMRTAREQLNCPLPIHIVSIPTLYPSGSEKQLIENLTGQQLATGQLPAALGLVIHNVGTAKAIYDVCVHDRPLTERLITITGDAIGSPGNYWVRLGTPIHFVLQQVGVQEEKLTQIVHGGPMMGWDIVSPDTPVDATTNCLIAASTELFPPPPPEAPCIRCGLCVEVCPARLLPQELLFLIKTKQYEQAHKWQLDQCIECGACSYVCPSHIPLVAYYRFGKDQWREIQAKNQKAELSRLRHERKLARIARQEAEKKARRQQRAANAARQADEKKKMVAEAVARVRAKKQTQGSTDKGQEG